MQAFSTRRPAGARAPFSGSSRATSVVVRAAVAAKPVSVPVKTADGASAGSEELALGVAPPATAKGLVHRYLVYVQQNARQVRGDEEQRWKVWWWGKKNAMARSPVVLARPSKVARAQLIGRSAAVGDAQDGCKPDAGSRREHGSPSGVHRATYRRRDGAAPPKRRALRRRPAPFVCKSVDRHCMCVR